MPIAKDAHVDEGLSRPEASPLMGLVPRIRCPEVWAQLELSAFTCLHKRGLSSYNTVASGELEF